MTNNKLFEAHSYISTIPVRGLTIESIMKIIELSGELENKSKSYSEARKKIFSSYGINVGEDDKFKEHPEYKTILETIETLDAKEAEIKCVGFLDLSELEKCIENYNSITVRGVEIMKTLMLKV